MDLPFIQWLVVSTWVSSHYTLHTVSLSSIAIRLALLYLCSCTTLFLICIHIEQLVIYVVNSVHTFFQTRPIYSWQTLFDAPFVMQVALVILYTLWLLPCPLKHVGSQAQRKWRLHFSSLLTLDCSKRGF